MNSRPDAVKKTWERGPVRTVLVSTMHDEAQRDRVVAKHLESRPDAVLLELEAGIVANHEGARRLVADVLAMPEYKGIQRVIKINPVGSEHLEPDLLAVAPHRPDAILMTLVTDPSEVVYMDRRLSELESALGMPNGEMRIWVLVERARAVVKLLDILEASPRVDLACFGPADLTADLGTSISFTGDDPTPGIETAFGRAQTVYAAKAAGKLAIDTGVINVRSEASGDHARQARRMGYDGMVAISPNQIPTIQAAFTPSEDEVDHAQRAVTLFHDGLVRGQGIANLDGEMVSKSVYEGYVKVLARAGVPVVRPVGIA